MKTAPTELDREAATLFTPIPGMRVWIDWSLPHEDSWGDGAWLRIVEGQWVDHVAAPDLDDPATVGCMLAQVASFPGPIFGAALVTAMRALKGRPASVV